VDYCSEQTLRLVIHSLKQANKPNYSPVSLLSITEGRWVWQKVLISHAQQPSSTVTNSRADQQDEPERLKPLIRQERMHHPSVMDRKWHWWIVSDCGLLERWRVHSCLIKGFNLPYTRWTSWPLTMSIMSFWYWLQSSCTRYVRVSPLNSGFGSGPVNTHFSQNLHWDSECQRMKHVTTVHHPVYHHAHTPLWSDLISWTLLASGTIGSRLWWQILPWWSTPHNSTYHIRTSNDPNGKGQGRLI